MNTACSLELKSRSYFSNRGVSHYIKQMVFTKCEDDPYWMTSRSSGRLRCSATFPRRGQSREGTSPLSLSSRLFQLNQQNMSFSGPRDLRSVLHWRQIHRLACLELCFHGLAIR